MTPWKLSPYEAYEAPGAAVLFFHNVYEEGKQGGFEILQRGERVAGNGNLRLVPAADQWDVLPQNGARLMESGGTGLRVSCMYEQAGIGYTVRLAPEGDALRLEVELSEQLPEAWVGRAGFNLELMPSAYMGKAFFMDGRAGIFPRQFNAAMRPGERGELEPEPLAVGRELVLTPEDPGSRLVIRALQGELALLDGRAYAQNGWFVVRGVLPGRVKGKALEWRVLPAVDPDWRREPVIGFSQVGYLPGQPKIAVIELDAQVDRPGEARLVRLTPNEEQLVKRANLELWGEYLCFHYARFDFSEVREPGLYRLEYENQRSEPFVIDSQVYERDVWQPTLEQYLPAQMCHVEVREVARIWHAACHLDDAIQAPLHHQHFDSYAQRETTETQFGPYEHIPGLDVGGWHDAGDFDLAAGSQAHTTHILALAREAFGVDSDQTTVDQARRLVVMHLPDGVPDIVQQVEHGALNLLSGYRVSGHSFIGIIENSLEQYKQLGEISLLTDNRVTPGEGSDDRWVFTHRHTTLEYQVAAALAASSRVLKGWNDALAQECLETARKAWQFEQEHEAQVAPNCYVGPRHDLAEVTATAELLITTGEGIYRSRLLGLVERIVEQIGAVGWAVARALPQVADEDFQRRVREAVAAYAAHTADEATQNPFGVPYSAATWRKQGPIWGVGWSLLNRAVDHYFLSRAFPDLVKPEWVAAVLGYILGCHPVSNASLASGVGAKSLTVAYGINRADWTYQPGGVVSGPALIRPNYPELLDPYPWLWQQKEYVIGGAATYVFTVLAVNQLYKFD